jgi:hypothetical protein
MLTKYYHFIYLTPPLLPKSQNCVYPAGCTYSGIKGSVDEQPGF